MINCFCVGEIYQVSKSIGAVMTSLRDRVYQKCTTSRWIKWSKTKAQVFYILSIGRPWGKFHHFLATNTKKSHRYWSPSSRRIINGVPYIFKCLLSQIPHHHARWHRVPPLSPPAWQVVGTNHGTRRRWCRSNWRDSSMASPLRLDTPGNHRWCGASSNNTTSCWFNFVYWFI